MNASLPLGKKHDYRQADDLETWIQSKLIYEGRVVSLRTGDVRMDDGTVAFREVVEHPGGVAVVPVIGNSVVLIRQFRIAIGRDVIELPAGKLEGVENPEERGRRELEEETGYRAGRMVNAGSVFASVGYTTEEIRLFFAFDLEKVGQNLEADECVEVVTIPLTEAECMIASNELKDAKTIVGILSLLRYLRGEAAHP